MPRYSAGLLLFRRSSGVLPEVFLVHPGGPFWKNKDEGVWSIPKGEHDATEDPLQAAKREFAEEVGLAIDGTFADLGAFRQPGGKIVHAWSVEGDCDPDRMRSNSFSLEWPPKSGHVSTFPEVDRAAWFAPAQAKRKILKGQVPILEALYRRFDARRR